VVVASKSGPVETGPTILVAMALLKTNSLSTYRIAAAFTVLMSLPLVGVSALQPGFCRKPNPAVNIR